MKKSKLNEGSWGFGSLQSDDALDRVDEFMDSMMINLKEKLSGLVGQRTDTSWTAIGLIDYVMTMLISSNTLYKVNKDILEILEKYYKKALKICISDKEWWNSYTEPDKMLSSLKTCQKTLQEYIDLCNNSDKKELTPSDVPEQSDSTGLLSTIYKHLKMEESVNPELKIEKIMLKDNDNIGYYYIDENVIGFDIGNFPTMEMIDKTIKTIKREYGINIDKSDLKLIDTSDIDTFNDVIDYPDLINLNANEYYHSDTFKKQQALHNADYVTKRNDAGMKAYLKDRDQNIGKKLTMQNGKEMPLSQWKALHSTSESKIKK